MEKRKLRGQKMDEDKEQNVYDEKVSEKLEEADEIDEIEEGFMKGYNEDIDTSRCATCGKILEKDVVEEEFDGDTYHFCSEECARKFEHKKDHQ